MPKFIDYHAQMPQLPPEAVEQMQARIRAGQADQFGVTPLNVFVSSHGHGWCLTDAPDAAAVCRAHLAVGVPLDAAEVHEVTALA